MNLCVKGPVFLFFKHKALLAEKIQLKFAPLVDLWSVFERRAKQTHTLMVI